VSREVDVYIAKEDPRPVADPTERFVQIRPCLVGVRSPVPIAVIGEEDLYLILLIFRDGQVENEAAGFGIDLRTVLARSRDCANENVARRACRGLRRRITDTKKGEAPREQRNGGSGTSGCAIDARHLASESRDVSCSLASPAARPKRECR
jgi:hypothetical protein